MFFVLQGLVGCCARKSDNGSVGEAQGFIDHGILVHRTGQYSPDQYENQNTY